MDLTLGEWGGGGINKGRGGGGDQLLGLITRIFQMIVLLVNNDEIGQCVSLDSCPTIS